MTADRGQRLRPGRWCGPILAAAFAAAVTLAALGAPRAAWAQAAPPEFARPRHVRGIYLSAWAAGSPDRVAALLDLAARTEINTFVIDVKDASGFMTYASSVPLAQEIGANEDPRVRDVRALLRRLAAQGIYPIARIVVFKDPVLAAARPDLAVRAVDGELWRDRDGEAWVNPYAEEAWEYNIAVAREAVALGFSEIQWDYVRFPDAPGDVLERAVFAGRDGRSREDAIRGFLARGREALRELGVPVTADVFGLTVAAKDDMGIGQRWERFIDVVDVALPMVYPSHFAPGSFQITTPNAYPYETVHRSLTRALERSARVPGAGAVRPWLQDFTLGEPRYGAPEVRAQIQATYDAGLSEWILWNPGSRYTADALAPAGGFPPGYAPLIRRAGRIMPANETVAEPVDGREPTARPPAAPRPRPPRG